NQVGINKDFPELDWDTVKIPKGFNGGERVVPMITNSWLINSKSDDDTKEAAWTFLKYYLDDDAQDTLAESGGSLPVKLSALEKMEGMTDTKPENKAAYTQGILEAGTTMDENATWGEWYSAVGPVFTDIRDAVLTPEEGLEEI